MKFYIALFMSYLLAFQPAFAGKLQNEDFKTEAQILAAGGTAAQLLNDSKIYISANNLNKTLKQAIIDRNIGGGGGAGGVNLASNSDFEINATTGWTASGVTVTNPTYAVSSTDNKKYAQVTTTVANGYYETVSQTVPTFLGNSDFEFQAMVRPVSGTWSIQTLSGTTIVASQTLTVGSDFAKSPIIFTPSGPTGTVVKTRFTATTSGSVLLVDDVYMGSIKSTRNGAVITQVPYTPTFAGMTANITGVNCVRIGPRLSCHGNFNTTSVSAVFFNFNLPPGLTLDKAAYTQKTPVGYSYRNVGANGNILLAVADRSWLGVALESDGGNKWTEVNANAAYANGENINFEFDVFIEQWKAGNGGTSFESTCPTAVGCENNFGAIVGAAGPVQSENLDWLNGNCTVNSAGNYTCNFNPGIFTVAPSCTVSVGDGAQYFSSLSPTSTSVTIQTWLDNGTATSRGFNLHCQKSGADFVSKRSIEGYLSKTVTSTAGLQRVEAVRFHGAGNDLNLCTTSPCTISRNTGGISSVTRFAAGSYNINFLAGTFSGPPVCTVTGTIQVTVADQVNTESNDSASVVWVRVYSTSSGSLTDTYGSVICVGPR